MTKTQKICYYVLLVLTSVLFVFSGYSKVSGQAAAIAGFQIAHLPIWFMYFIGTCEIVGGIALWFGVSSKPGMRCLAKWATYGLYIILAGAVVTTAMFMNIPEALFPLVVGIILFILTWLGKKRTMTISSVPAA